MSNNVLSILFIALAGVGSILLMYFSIESFLSNDDYCLLLECGIPH